MLKILKFIFFLFLFSVFSLVVSTLFFEIRDVKGDKMEPNLKHREKAFFRKFFWSAPCPARSDVVLYAANGENEANFIGRVIGLPKEKIMIKNGNIYINDNLHFYKLIEKYLSKGALTKSDKEEWVSVGEFEYLILLDNREDSVNLKSHLVHRNDIKAVFMTKFFQ